MRDPTWALGSSMNKGRIVGGAADREIAQPFISPNADHDPDLTCCVRRDGHMACQLPVMLIIRRILIWTAVGLSIVQRSRL
jgi:hypothetical protein